MTYFPDLETIRATALNLKEVANITPLTYNILGSEKYGANIHFKREDLQIVRSYKIRGAYNKISSLSESEKNRGIICASAGNHAQGVAYACRKLGIKGKIFMPLPTPKQKVNQVAFFGKEWVDIVLEGDTFDDAYNAALTYGNANGLVFIHPFDDKKVIEGQATVGLEIIEQSRNPVDILILPIGGGLSLIHI